MPYGILDMANRSVKSRDKFLALLTSTIDMFDRRSVVSPDSLRYNQTIGYSYQSSYTLLLYMLKIGIDSGCITKTEGSEYLDKILNAHYENLEYELINPAVDYTKLKGKAKRTKSSESKEKKPRESKAKPKIKIDLSTIGINLKDIL
jgi:hypothetical protein